MAPPNASVWTTSTNGDAWFVSNVPGVGRRSCLDNGLHLLYSLQTELVQRMRDLGERAVTYDGSVVQMTDLDPAITYAAGVIATGQWTRDVLRVFWAVASAARAPAYAKDAIAADARRGTGEISLRTLQAAIWAAYFWGGQTPGTYGLDSPDVVALPAQVALPSLGAVMVPGPGFYAGTGNVCVALAPGQLADVRPPSSTSTGVWIAVAILAAAVAGAAYISRDVPTAASQAARRRRARP